MELFHNDGHLTDEGIRAIIENTLDEMQSLEAAEHLSFCDACLSRYTLALTDDILLTPSVPLKEPVLRRLRKKAVHVLFSRYGTVAAAACLAMALWFGGMAVFPGPSVAPGNMGGNTTTAAQGHFDNAHPEQSTDGFSLSEKINSATRSAADGFSEFLYSIGSPQEAREKAEAKDTTKSS